MVVFFFSWVVVIIIDRIIYKIKKFTKSKIKKDDENKTQEKSEIFSYIKNRDRSVWKFYY